MGNGDVANTNGDGAAKIERKILGDIARWLIPILLMAVLGFVWNTNSKVGDLEMRIVRLETMACMTKAPGKTSTRYGSGEAQAAVPAED